MLLPKFAAAQAPQSKVVDKRNASEVGEYGISFASRDTSANDYEHAFIVWYYSDDAHHRTNRKGAGFYPAGGDKYDLTIGGTDGVVFDDSKEKIAKEIVVLVNKDIFAAAQAIQTQYQKGETYRLIVNDCVSFIEAVAGTIPGLSVPSRTLNPTPPLFVSALFNGNN
ncbi:MULTISPECIES: hypothetical protein [Bradyrhizobium]|uniref:hypothetical protein n=1 Tax=Bradyrhizobium TaxID=374 RepID=UPI001EDC3869|nr:hypothetical protein [Bradyrhizobium zhengyangense]MCG2641431.1 hypothetical protein [Bradyrhizobium zhengyangense]